MIVNIMNSIVQVLFIGVFISSPLYAVQQSVDGTQDQPADTAGERIVETSGEHNADIEDERTAAEHREHLEDLKILLEKKSRELTRLDAQVQEGVKYYNAGLIAQEVFGGITVTAKALQSALALNATGWKMKSKEQFKAALDMAVKYRPKLKVVAIAALVLWGASTWFKEKKLKEVSWTAEQRDILKRRIDQMQKDISDLQGAQIILEEQPFELFSEEELESK